MATGKLYLTIRWGTVNTEPRSRLFLALHPKLSAMTPKYAQRQDSVDKYSY